MEAEKREGCTEDTDIAITIGHNGTELSQASINTWTSKVRTLKSLGVDFSSYDDIVGTIEER